MKRAEMLTKDEVTNLIFALRKWIRRIDDLTTPLLDQPLRPARFVPTLPPLLVQRVALVVTAFPDARFPALEDVVADPASPRIRDAVKELAKVRDLSLLRLRQSDSPRSAAT
jgi:hypothetical protein